MTPGAAATIAAKAERGDLDMALLLGKSFLPAARNWDAAACRAFATLVSTRVRAYLVFLFGQALRSIELLARALDLDADELVSETARHSWRWRRARGEWPED